MGMLVRLVGSGIGLASEALHNRKVAKAEAELSKQRSSGEGSSARAPQQVSYDDPPPEYVEVSEETGRALIAEGRAVPTNDKYPDEKKGRDPYAYTYPDEKAGHNLNNPTTLEEKANHSPYEEDDDTQSEEGDEEAWELDEASRELVDTRSEEQGPPVDMENLTDAFIRNHPPPPYSGSQLPCPVILPQRRPRDKKRGFVRAYAPVLEDCGIDQETFLDFLKTFHTSCKADNWLQVVNLAAGIVGFVPGPITMGVSMGIQFAVGVAMEVQRRTRSNSFLDRMNNEFFKPRGLYCLVMTYKPDSTASHERVDINQTIMSYSTPASSSTRQMMQNLRISSGKTYGDFELPEAAPLIFPALEHLADDDTAEGQQKQAKATSGNNKKFVADYFDRRAQATYAAETSGGKLASLGEQPVFHSRYADPNHAASSGGLVALITGGNVSLQARKNEKRERREERRTERRQRKAWRKGEPVTEETGRRRSRRDRKRGGLVKRILKKDVLYLMIVNLPTEAETQAGRASVATEPQVQYRY